MMIFSFYQFGEVRNVGASILWWIWIIIFINWMFLIYFIAHKVQWTKHKILCPFLLLLPLSGMFLITLWIKKKREISSFAPNCVLIFIAYKKLQESFSLNCTVLSEMSVNVTLFFFDSSYEMHFFCYFAIIHYTLHFSFNNYFWETDYIVNKS